MAVVVGAYEIIHCTKDDGELAGREDGVCWDGFVYVEEGSSLEIGGFASVPFRQQGRRGRRDLRRAQKPLSKARTVLSLTTQGS